MVSITVFRSFVALSLSGLFLFVSAQGRVAYWSPWTLAGLTKEQLSAVHATMTVPLVVGIFGVLNGKGGAGEG